MFLAFDYGNGDGLYLEPGEPTCRLWWFGHDSWPVALIARSLREYVERSVAYLEEVARRSALAMGDDPEDEIPAPYDTPPGPYEPQVTCAGVSVHEAIAREVDETTAGFLRALDPAAAVFDFRGIECPARAELSVAAGVLTRCDQVIAFTPEK